MRLRGRTIYLHPCRNTFEIRIAPTISDPLRKWSEKIENYIGPPNHLGLDHSPLMLGISLGWLFWKENTTKTKGPLLERLQNKHGKADRQADHQATASLSIYVTEIKVIGLGYFHLTMIIMTTMRALRFNLSYVSAGHKRKASENLKPDLQKKPKHTMWLHCFKKIKLQLKSFVPSKKTRSQITTTLMLSYLHADPPFSMISCEPTTPGLSPVRSTLPSPPQLFCFGDATSWWWLVNPKLFFVDFDPRNLVKPSDPQIL